MRFNTIEIDPQTEERFWGHVDKTGECWNWTGSIRPNGYGKYGAKNLHPHRVSWFLRFGIIPTGKYICHHCDNRRCVHPDHLFVGTQSENMKDAVRKGRCRNPRGAKSPNAKLTQPQANEIRQLHLSGKTYRTLGQIYAVSEKTIRGIIEYGNYRP